VFIMAVSSGFRGAAGLSGSLTRHEGQPGIVDDCGAQDMWPSRPGEPQHAWEPPRTFEPTLGRNTARTVGGMDYAKLCTTCDNRTDELRLLGNGVVPATAVRAFRVLMSEIQNQI